MLKNTFNYDKFMNSSRLGTEQQSQLADHLKCGEVYTWLCGGELYAVECKLCEDHPLCPLSEYPQHMEVWHFDWETTSQNDRENKSNQNFTDDEDDKQDDSSYLDDDRNDEEIFLFESDDQLQNDKIANNEEHEFQNNEDILEPFEQVLIEQEITTESSEDVNEKKDFKDTNEQVAKAERSQVENKQKQSLKVNKFLNSRVNESSPASNVRRANKRELQYLTTVKESNAKCNVRELTGTNESNVKHNVNKTNVFPYKLKYLKNQIKVKNNKNVLKKYADFRRHLTIGKDIKQNVPEIRDSETSVTENSKSKRDFRKYSKIKYIKQNITKIKNIKQTLSKILQEIDDLKEIDETSEIETSEDGTNCSKLKCLEKDETFENSKEILRNNWKVLNDLEKARKTEREKSKAISKCKTEINECETEHNETVDISKTNTKNVQQTENSAEAKQNILKKSKHNIIYKKNIKTSWNKPRRLRANEADHDISTEIKENESHVERKPSEIETIKSELSNRDEKEKSNIEINTKISKQRIHGNETTKVKNINKLKKDKCYFRIHKKYRTKFRRCRKPGTFLGDYLGKLREIRENKTRKANKTRVSENKPRNINIPSKKNDRITRKNKKYYNETKTELKKIQLKEIEPPVDGYETEKSEKQKVLIQFRGPRQNETGTNENVGISKDQFSKLENEITECYKSLCKNKSSKSRTRDIESLLNENIRELGLEERTIGNETNGTMFSEFLHKTLEVRKNSKNVLKRSRKSRKNIKEKHSEVLTEECEHKTEVHKIKRSETETEQREREIELSKNVIELNKYKTISNEIETELNKFKTQPNDNKTEINEAVEKSKVEIETRKYFTSKTALYLNQLKTDENETINTENKREIRGDEKDTNGYETYETKCLQKPLEISTQTKKYSMRSRIRSKNLKVPTEQNETKVIDVWKDEKCSSSAKSIDIVAQNLKNNNEYFQNAQELGDIAIQLQETKETETICSNNLHSTKRQSKFLGSRIRKTKLYENETLDLNKLENCQTTTEESDKKLLDHKKETDNLTVRLCGSLKQNNRNGRCLRSRSKNKTNQISLKRNNFRIENKFNISKKFRSKSSREFFESSESLQASGENTRALISTDQGIRRNSVSDTREEELENIALVTGKSNSAINNEHLKNFNTPTNHKTRTRSRVVKRDKMFLRSHKVPAKEYICGDDEACDSNSSHKTQKSILNTDFQEEKFGQNTKQPLDIPVVSRQCATNEQTVKICNQFKDNNSSISSDPVSPNGTTSLIEEPLSPLSPKTEEEHFEFYEPKEKLNKQHISHLIKLYQEHSRLWDQAHPDFCEPQLCRKSWEEITEKWNDFCKRTFTITEVRIRISTLCQRFIQERERLALEGELDECAKFPYYEQMQFLEKQKSLQKRRELYEQQNEKILEIYQHFPVLWHISCYKLRQPKERAQAFDNISKTLKLTGLYLSSAAVQKRIRSLRKCYRLEKIRHLHALVEQTSFKSEFRHYERMQFMDKHVDPFVCRICGKIFENLQGFREHLEIENHGSMLPEESEADSDEDVQDIEEQNVTKENSLNQAKPEDYVFSPISNYAESLAESENSRDILQRFTPFASTPNPKMDALEMGSPPIQEVLKFPLNTPNEPIIDSLRLEDQLIEKIMENVTNNDCLTQQGLDQFINSVTSYEELSNDNCIANESFGTDIMGTENSNVIQHPDIITDQTSNVLKPESKETTFSSDLLYTENSYVVEHPDIATEQTLCDLSLEPRIDTFVTESDFVIHQQVVEVTDSAKSNDWDQTTAKRLDQPQVDPEKLPLEELFLSQPSVTEKLPSCESLVVKVQCADFSLDLKLNPEPPSTSDSDNEVYCSADITTMPLSDHLIHKMIEIYRKFPQLWNPNHLDYNSRNLRRQAWCSLTTEFNAAVGIQISWRTLHRKLTDYVKYYKKLIEQVDYERLENKWTFYKDFQFMNDVIAVQDELQRSVHHRDNNFKIIAIYETFPQLWNIKHPDYNKRTTKQRNIELMCNRLQDENNLQLTTERLKNRLIELRTQYRVAKKQRLKCLKNQQIFSTDFEFYEALNFLDDHIDPFICDKCKMEFKKLTDYNQHLKREHSRKPDLRNKSLAASLAPDSVTENICHICARKFTTRSNLLHHIKRHEGIRNYECTMCPKKFYASHSLKVHIRSHTKECPYTCEKCGISFVSASKLNQHVKRHLNRKDFQCDFCPKSFFTAYEKDRHEKRHLNIRDKACPICGKTFVAGSSYYAHLMLHNDTKRFECTKCNMKFAQYAGLYKHKKRHHES